MKNKRISWKDDLVEIKTDKRTVKKLAEITKMRILDLKGNLIMTFWKGEQHS